MEQTGQQIIDYVQRKQIELPIESVKPIIYKREKCPKQKKLI